MRIKKKESESVNINIYIAGDIGVAKQVCREYCWDIGFCVSISECDYIYTGGEENGVCVGVINYPRFPTDKNELMDKSINLAKNLITEMFQESASVVGPNKTVWLSRRESKERDN